MEWATGDSLRVAVHGLHLVMVTDKELAVWDPVSKKMLQLFNEFPDPNGKYTALGTCKGKAYAAYLPNPRSKKTFLQLFKEISFEKQIEQVLSAGEIDQAYKLFSIEYRGSWNKDALADAKRQLDTNIGWTLFFNKLEFNKGSRYLEDGKVDIRQLMLYFSFTQNISVMKRIPTFRDGFPFLSVHEVIGKAEAQIKAQKEERELV